MSFKTLKGTRKLHQISTSNLVNSTDLCVKKYSCLCIHCQNGDFANCINHFMLQKYSESKVVTFGLINGVEAVDCDEVSENEEEDEESDNIHWEESDGY